MNEVGIRALKQNASAVIASVAAGQSVTITDRGRPAARLTPLTHTRLEGLAQSGDARVARRRMTALPMPSPGPTLTGAVIEARECERF